MTHDESRMDWPDYVAQDFVHMPAPETDADAKRLIPQIPAAQALYEVHRLLGKSILEAMALTLECVQGVTA